MGAEAGMVSAAAGWEAALAAALVGAERAPVASGGGLLAGLARDGDAGATLLARLAAQGVHYLAGTGRPAEALTPAPPLEAGRPECPPAAAARLAMLLAGDRSSPARLEEWCGLAVAAGVRAPPWLVPALAPHRRDWPAAIDRIAGAELDWLDRASADGMAADASPASPDWTDGSPLERRAAFVALRQRDPDAACAALEAGFRAEKAEMRQHLVSALEISLGDADEPFLEACLDDRATGVRAAAQTLLPRLGRSRFAARMADRAQTALVIESKRRLLGGTKHALIVVLPEESASLARDGVEPKSYERHGSGTRAGLLRDVLASAPLHAFASHPPRLWITLALRGEWATPIFEGLLQCVRRAGDPAWLHDLADVLGEAHAGRLGGITEKLPLLEMWARATMLLPDAEWERAVTDLMRARKLEAVLAMVSRGPSALSAPFTAALLDWLAFVTRGSAGLRQDISRSGVINHLAERAHPSEDAAASVAAILARLPDDSDAHLRNQISAFADTLALRATMRGEFSQA